MERAEWQQGSTFSFLGGDSVFRQVSVEYGFGVNKVVGGLPGVFRNEGSRPT